MNENPDTAIVEHESNWRFWLGAVCAGCLALPWIYHSSSGFNFGYAIGYYIIPALVVWAIFKATAMKGQKDKSSGLIFGCVFASMILGAGLFHLWTKAQIVAAASSLQKSADAFFEGDKQRKAGLPTTQIDSTPQAKGEMGEMERYLKTAMNRISNSQVEFSKDMAEAGQAQLADFSTVGRPEVLNGRIAIAKKCLALCQARKASYLTLMNSLSQEISNLNVSDETRMDIRHGFDNSMRNAHLDEMLDMYIKSYALILDQYEILSRNYGKWQVENGNLLFTDQKALEAFNRDGKLIQSINTKLIEMAAQGQQEVNKNLQNLKAIGQ